MKENDKMKVSVKYLIRVLNNNMKPLICIYKDTKSIY